MIVTTYIAVRRTIPDAAIGQFPEATMHIRRERKGNSTEDVEYWILERDSAAGVNPARTFNNNMEVRAWLDNID